MQARTKGGARVLVVDDNTDAAKLLSMLLRLDGHQVQVTYCGESALVAAEAFEPHVIVLDIGLPGKDGYEVCKELRTRPQFEQTCIVALTGYGGQADMNKALGAGFNQHLIKPADYACLKEIIERYCESINLNISPLGAA